MLLRSEMEAGLTRDDPSFNIGYIPIYIKTWLSMIRVCHVFTIPMGQIQNFSNKPADEVHGFS